MTAGPISQTTPTRHAGGAGRLVKLDRDHPGFRDPDYRARRNHIAQLALDYRDGRPIPQVVYTDEEQEVWRMVWRKLAPLHEQLACREVLEADEAVGISRQQVPQFEDLNKKLVAATGFRMLPVAGLVCARVFLSYLGDAKFLSTQYMRHCSKPLYTPEPDVVHELIGHAATLAHPLFARLNRAFGRGAAVANEAECKRLENLYWYSVEFGLLREDGDIKAWGAGLLSSFGELGQITSGPKLLPFDPEVAAATDYDPTYYQRVLFVTDSLATTVDRLCDWLDAFVERRR